MKRIRCVSAHLLPQHTTGQATCETQEQLSPQQCVPPLDQSAHNPTVSAYQDKSNVSQNVLDFRQGADELMQTGKLPSSSMWDLLLETRHETQSRQGRDVGRLLDEAMENGSLKVLDSLPGPWQDTRTREARISLIHKHQMEQMLGRDVFMYAQLQMQYGDHGLSSNIAAPKAQAAGSGSKSITRVIPRVIVADPEDAERISRTHVRKEGNFEPAFFDSIISTTDNEHWIAQRQHLVEAFLPMSSLSRIMPVSLQRAMYCADRLQQIASSTSGVVDMSDFLLHEAQAQLQLALLGAPESLMNATNAEIRAAFSGDISRGHVGALGEAMKSLMEFARSDKTLAVPSDGCPVRGPLSRAVQNSGLPASADYGNMLLILFAGHDTTGHTMTWFLFELARHPEIQTALHKEVDDFFQSLGAKELQYKDLGNGSLDMLDRCVTETLRLWPAVAAGTYRQLQFEDTIRGPCDTQVTLPKGTPMHIVNWSRHRNPEVWGPDADEFNPYREFNSEEVARVGCPLAGMTPQSELFSPFAHNPRSCLGKNFAQMEMRVILIHLLKRFEFSLAPPHDAFLRATLGAIPRAGEFYGLNRGTMGPIDASKCTRHSWGERHMYGMHMRIKSRS